VPEPTRPVWIEGAAGPLEALARVAPTPRGAAVISHPHPLHGGTLHHPVMFHTDRELNRAGWTTLRFNFRGVGASAGTHDEGRGEVDDVARAVDRLVALAPGVPLVLVGYSFGAWCSVRHAVTDPRVAGLVAIGLPVQRFDFDALDRLGRPLAVVQGDADELGPLPEVRALLARARPPGRLYVVGRAGHLFPHQAPVVAARVVEAASGLLEID
jgi:uncharacterized protein